MQVNLSIQSKHSTRRCYQTLMKQFDYLLIEYNFCLQLQKKKNKFKRKYSTAKQKQKDKKINLEHRRR